MVQLMVMGFTQYGPQTLDIFIHMEPKDSGTGRTHPQGKGNLTGHITCIYVQCTQAKAFAVGSSWESGFIPSVSRFFFFLSHH